MTRAALANVLGIGTDIVECLRIAQMIERHGELFINRVYTPHEVQYCQSRKQATQHFAGRWAAKTAVGEYALPRLYERIPGLELATDRDTRWDGWVFRGITALPVTW